MVKKSMKTCLNPIETKEELKGERNVAEIQKAEHKQKRSLSKKKIEGDSSFERSIKKTEQNQKRSCLKRTSKETIPTRGP